MKLDKQQKKPVVEGETSMTTMIKRASSSSRSRKRLKLSTAEKHYIYDFISPPVLRNYVDEIASSPAVADDDEEDKGEYSDEIPTQGDNGKDDEYVVNEDEKFDDEGDYSSEISYDAKRSEEVF